MSDLFSTYGSTDATGAPTGAQQPGGIVPAELERRRETEPDPAGDHDPASSDHAVVSAAEKLDRRRALLLNWLLPLLLLAGGAGVVLALGEINPPERPAADTSREGRLQALPPVRVTKIQSLAETGADLHLRVDGTVVPFREVQIATEVAGRIVYKSDICESGSYVAKDTLLVRIDPTDYELDVERFKRQQEQAYQALREVDQDMANTRRLIDVAERDVELQLREVKRLESLPRGFASDGETDQARRSMLQAEQQQVTYENQYSALEKRRASQESAEKLAATQLRVAEVNLSRTEIRAPIEGVIVREDAELNSFVSRGNPIVTMEDTSKVEVASSLRMDQLFWVINQNTDASPMTANQTNYDLPETPAVIEYEMSGRDGVVYRWQGRLLGYDGIGLDPRTRTVPIRVLVDQPSRFVDERGQQRETNGPTALVRGMYVRVLLTLKPQQELFVIPALALKPGNRVWTFSRDDSILDVPVTEDTNGENKAASAVTAPAESPAEQPDAPAAGDSLKAADDKSLDGFDPADWIPGRVDVVESVLPIDSLTVGITTQPTGSDSANEPGRSWVCEDRTGKLRSGGFVVVSPLGTVTDNGMSARAEVPDSKPTGELAASYAPQGN